MAAVHRHKHGDFHQQTRAVSVLECGVQIGIAEPKPRCQLGLLPSEGPGTICSWPPPASSGRWCSGQWLHFRDFNARPLSLLLSASHKVAAMAQGARQDNLVTSRPSNSSYLQRLLFLIGDIHSPRDRTCLNPSERIPHRAICSSPRPPRCRCGEAGPVGVLRS